MPLRIASIGSSGRVIVWDRSRLLRLKRPETQPPSLRLGLGRAYVSFDGRWLMRVVNGDEFLVEDSAGDVQLRWMNPGADPFLRGAWHPTRPVFVGALADGVFVIEVKDGVVQEPVKVAPLGVQVGEVTWNAAGTTVAVSTWAARVVAFEIPSGRKVFDYPLPSPVGSNCVTWCPDGSRVAIGCSDGAIRILQAGLSPEARLEPELLRGHSGEVEGIAWHPDGSRIATASRDRTVKLWNPETGHLVGSLECADLVSDVVWVRGGAELIAVDLKGRIYSYDASRALQGRDAELPPWAAPPLK